MDNIQHVKTFDRHDLQTMFEATTATVQYSGAECCVTDDFRGTCTCTVEKHMHKSLAIVKLSTNHIN
jgi:hypothetical protein